MEQKWKVTKVNKTEDGTVVSAYASDEFDNKVSFKWDGCIDLHHDDNYIHICDVDEMIEKLQEIKRMAKENFDEDNYSTYWTK
ncbi:hypothetical protein [Bacillus infantis]|uniref:hypothetical protein n=1 Tax=Bacillus infantis TaxID=324767 RepID=UPI003CF13881